MRLLLFLLLLIGSFWTHAAQAPLVALLPSTAVLPPCDARHQRILDEELRTALLRHHFRIVTQQAVQAFFNAHELDGARPLAPAYYRDFCESLQVRFLLLPQVFSPVSGKPEDAEMNFNGTLRIVDSRGKTLHFLPLQVGISLPGGMEDAAERRGLVPLRYAVRSILEQFVVPLLKE